MRSSVTISLVPEARGGPFVFWDDLEASCEHAAALGFDAVEVFPPGANASIADRLRRTLRAGSLSLAAVGTGAGWLRHRLSLSDPELERRQAAVEFVSEIIDFAGQLGAPAIVGSMQGRCTSGEDRRAARDRLREALDQLGRRAARHGVPLLYEPLNRYETDLCQTISAGRELLAGLADDNVRLLADLFHMNIEEADLGAALRHGADLIGHVHFVDSNRCAVGMGHLDVAPVIAALRAIGYNGYVSAEALPLPDSMTAAQRTIDAFRAWSTPD